MATYWLCKEFDAEPRDSDETVAQMGNKHSKLLGHGFLTKYDIIVAIATTCATTATH